MRLPVARLGLPDSEKAPNHQVFFPDSESITRKDPAHERHLKWERKCESKQDKYLTNTDGSQ